MATRKTIVTIPSTEYLVDSNSNFGPCITLYDDTPQQLLRSDDIISFSVQNPSNFLKSIHFIIGGSRIASFDREDFIDGKNLFPQGLPISKSYFHITKVEFEYNHDYITDNEESIMIDEFILEPELSDEEEMFFDGDGYISGRRVTSYKNVPTGRQVKKILKPATVEIPEVHIEVGQVGQSNIPVWESIHIDQKSIDEDYLNRLIEKSHLHMPSGEDVKTLYSKGNPFTAKLQNNIHFHNGMAAKSYVF